MIGSGRRSRHVEVAVFAVALAARLGWGLAVRVPPAWDGELYERAAQGIARGLGYSCFMFGPAADPTVPTAYYPVGYPAFLGALYAVFGAHPATLIVSGALVGAATMALAHRLALGCAPRWAAHAAALLFALAPGSVIFATTPMSETLWGLLLIAVVAVLGRPGVGVRSLVGAGVLLAAATYVRPQAAVLAVLLPMVLDGDLRTRVRRAAVVTATVLALVAPWTARNCASIDGCAFVSTNGGGNVAIGAVSGAVGTYRALTVDDGCRGVVGERARERCWQAVAVREVRARPLRWLRLGWSKLYHTVANEAFPAGYLRVARPDLVDEARETRLRDVMTAVWGVLWITAALGLLPTHPRRPMPPVLRLCLATVFGVAATHAVVFGGDRYHLPLVGLVAVLAAGALRELPGASSRGGTPDARTG